jgi:hypothetical protein
MKYEEEEICLAAYNDLQRQRVIQQNSNQIPASFTCERKVKC